MIDLVMRLGLYIGIFAATMALIRYKTSTRLTSPPVLAIILIYVLNWVSTGQFPLAVTTSLSFNFWQPQLFPSRKAIRPTSSSTMSRTRVGPAL